MDFGFSVGRGAKNLGVGGGYGGFGGNQYYQGLAQGFGGPPVGGYEVPFGDQFGGQFAGNQAYMQGGYGNQPFDNQGFGDQGFGGGQYGGDQFGGPGFGEQDFGPQGGIIQGFNKNFNQFSVGDNLGEQIAQWFKQDLNAQTGFQIRDKVVEEILYEPSFMMQGADWQKEVKRNTNSVIKGGDINLANLLTKQVVMIQSCPLQQKIQQLKAQGRKYEDNVFPATLKSLTGEHGHVSDWSSIKWKSASSVVSKYRLFDDLIHPNDIKQGKLGDCYFLAALAALAEQPQRILNLFLIPKQNPQGYCVCKILYKGKWKTIDMDEMIPVDNNSPAFSKAVNQELWVVMLEKAWAKLYSSYKRIQAGYPEEGLHDLTGAHIRAIRFKRDFNKQAEWDYLIDATERKFAMIASSQPGSDTNVSVSGIVDGHAYTFLGAYELEFQGRMERVCKLRNPWGKTESTGKWNDSDPRWKQVSPQQIQRLGYTKADDGIFFMPYDDFVSNFRMLTIAEINDNASYVYSTQKSTAAKGNYFKVKVIKEGNYSFQINQIPQRTYPDKDQQNHKYADATIKIGKVMGGGNYKEFEGSTSSYRTLFRRHTLQPGEYVVWGKIAFNDKWERDYELTLAIYADYVCEVENITENDCLGFNKALDRGDAVKSSLIPGGVGAEEGKGGVRKCNRRRQHKGGDFNTFNQGGYQGGFEQQGWGGNQQFGGQPGGQYGNQYNQYGGQYGDQFGGDPYAGQFGGNQFGNSGFGGNQFGVGGNQPGPRNEWNQPPGYNPYGGGRYNQGGFGQGGW